MVLKPERPNGPDQRTYINVMTGFTRNRLLLIATYNLSDLLFRLWEYNRRRSLTINIRPSFSELLEAGLRRLSQNLEIRASVILEPVKEL